MTRISPASVLTQRADPVTGTVLTPTTYGDRVRLAGLDWKQLHAIGARNQPGVLAVKEYAAVLLVLASALALHAGRSFAASPTIAGISAPVALLVGALLLVVVVLGLQISLGHRRDIRFLASVGYPDEVVDWRRIAVHEGAYTAEQLVTLRRWLNGDALRVAGGVRTIKRLSSWAVFVLMFAFVLAMVVAPHDDLLPVSLTLVLAVVVAARTWCEVAMLRLSSIARACGASGTAGPVRTI